MDNNIREIIDKLEKFEMRSIDVPEEFALNKEVVRTERRLGLRITEERGFDVLQQTFFVLEKLLFKKQIDDISPIFTEGEMSFKWSYSRFLSFEELYDFLDGNVYTNACYQFYDFEKEKDFMAREKVNLTILKERKAFVNCTVDDFEQEANQEGIVATEKNLEYHIKKGGASGFFVEQSLSDENGTVFKRKRFFTNWLVDFAYFLKNDLSNAYLLFCDGLENLPVDCGINFTGATVKSCVCEKFGLKYELYPLNEEFTREFELPHENEKTTSDSLDTVSVQIMDNSAQNLTFNERYEGVWDYSSVQRIFYITDIHLIHRMKHSAFESKADVIYMVSKITDTISHEMGKLLLIGGDISADPELFAYFVDTLKDKIGDSKSRAYKEEVVFILGNHELWSYQGKSVEEIKRIYKDKIESRGMFLLQNDLLYKNSDGDFILIPYEELNESTDEQLRDRLRNARLVILGGIGFSGYNQEFNADSGVYGKTLSRADEIEETAKFEKLYNRLVPIIADKNVIILTHMPLKDWCASGEPQKNFFYISGHTHKNEFYDDGCYRIYADNQIGYGNRSLHLKTFLMDTSYEYFGDYADGIYEITREQYADFYKGLNRSVCFNRSFLRLYMLKKHGYYCFIRQDKQKKLGILNGGKIKGLLKKDIQYYYDNMDNMVSRIKGPLDKFTEYQQRIADEVIKIGGSGNIHGCIIDIDGLNHIYVNPDDLQITGYWALDMVEKYAYRDVPSLLEHECPRLYANYLKLIEAGGENEFAIIKSDKIQTKISEAYFSTDIYRKSNEICKMQKLKNNLLCAWYEDTPSTQKHPKRLPKQYLLGRG